MVFAEADFENLIDLIYEAPLDSGLWPEVLHRFARSVNAKGAILLPLSAPTTLLASASPDLRDAAQAYAAGWWKYDSLVKSGSERRMRGVVTHLDVFEKASIDKDPFFQDFRRSFGMGGTISFASEIFPQSVVSIAIQLDYGKDLLSVEERSRFDILCRHVIRAIKVAARVENPLTLKANLAEAMQSLTLGMAIVDQSQSVVFANRRFEGLSQRGLKICQNRLFAEQASQQPKLERIIAEAVKPSRAPTVGNTIALGRPGSRPLLLQVIPLRGGVGENGFAALADRRHALVIATDPDESLPTGESSLLSLGLTAAEARIARLIGNGLSPAEAATQLGNSEETVRTLLKRVYLKLGINRQAQLANLFARLTLVE